MYFPHTMYLQILFNSICRFVVIFNTIQTQFFGFFEILNLRENDWSLDFWIFQKNQLVVYPLEISKFEPLFHIHQFVGVISSEIDARALWLVLWIAYIPLCLKHSCIFVFRVSYCIQVYLQLYIERRIKTNARMNDFIII